MVQWDQVVTTYELPFISDHAPMTILLQSQQRPRNVPFKFFNVWATHDKFLHIVKDVWSQRLSKHRMKDVWLKLQALKPALRKLNNTEFKFIRAKIDTARTELNRVQEHLFVHATDNMIIQEKNILLNLEKWSLLEESALKQKSRARWIQLGDSNNKYFSAVSKERNHRKQIMEITSLTGQKLHDYEEIKQEFVNFYKSLMGSSAHSLPAVNKIIMKKGPTLTHQQRLRLCAAVNTEEIYNALQAIGDEKAPGIDGYNALFFKQSWNIIKDEIEAAVLEFFSTGQLHAPVNCTIVSLVPKITKPSNHSLLFSFV
ncbi:uncharacterized protein LOC132624686 [Lycium barbarum]|uniref:uncharacterized protein LOC132624686 n=1 Tax=Lycium barbarum TaxID=112863 RepID=UPI00293E36F9|nr:uncharacterized protein LOC132624686 [Lycium barbarum]